MNASMKACRFIPIPTMLARIFKRVLVFGVHVAYNMVKKTRSFDDVIFKER